ncbi:meiotic recombination protein REC8 homolog [Rana temporaria]|uniref:meiotic recombination protein REC8 homolog n=1 Tax=Rana temporaria TaxID=8407 RepID=UPI001AAD8409|nr:meiotic recombination protein REC8 homolog [Rana temporaria]
MFYFPNVLQRHTGCFSTVWLAATKGTRIVKREYLKVNVMSTCLKIMQYILQQVPPPYHGCPIPRLSLYLSAQLSYGVVCVYHRQCDLLIEEMKVTLERLYKAEKQLKIDFLQTDQQLLLPDSLMLMQMLEDAPDPFFGMMDIPPELPDPYMIPQIRTLLETSGPELVRYERTPPRHRRSRKEEGDHLASPEAITMREVEPILLPPVEVGQDLPELSALDLELLASNLPAFPEAETLPEPRKRSKREPKDGLPETEKPKKPRKEREVQEDDRETSLGMERERQLQLERERYEADIEKRRRELLEMERSIELLRGEQRQRERQRESERQQEREVRKERESEVLQEMEKEMEHLREAKEELDYLQITGEAEDLLMEQLEEVEHLNELAKERASQWEAEKLLQLQLEKEKERERLKERARERKQIKEAEQELEALKTSLIEIEEERRRTEGEQVDGTRMSVTEVRGSPIPGVPSEMVSEFDAPMQLEEVPVEPIAMPPEGAPELPSPQQVSPQLVVPELDDRPIRRTARGTRLIIDKNTQIESKMMQKQTSDPNVFTQLVGPVILPHMKPRTATSLIESPTYEHFMAPELTALWSRCAVLEPLQYIREREEETFSELEMVRAIAESGVSIMQSSEMSLEVSEEDRSRPIIFTPEEGRIPSVQEDKLLPIVSEMPEIIVEMPETEEILLEDVERKLYSQIDSDGQSEFLGLTPHSFSRMLVSKFFSSCLVLCTQKVIRMEQTEPYGRIRITPGRQYKQD